MHPEWAAYLRVLLALHITCGVVAFLCAPIALTTVKGGRVHRRWGKVYFWAMAGVAVTALILSFALPAFFLAMVAVFSFYSAFAAYRVLYLKDMYRGARPKAVDWFAAVVTVLSSYAAIPHGFPAARVDGSGRDPDGRTYGEHCFHRIRDHRNAHGSGFNPWLYQGIGREDVLVVCPYAGDDRQLHRSDDRFFRSESVALVWRGLVGMAVATILGVPAIAIWTTYYKKKFSPKPKIAVA